MIRATLCFAVLAGPAVAEGRNDPFYRCTFDDGRIVILAEQGDGFEWREGSFVAPLVAEPRLNYDPIISFMGLWADPERIDVFVGWQEDGGVSAKIGSAMLTRTIMGEDGLLAVSQQAGTCEDYFG